MCDPFTIGLVGAGMAAAGTLVKMQQNQVMAARQNEANQQAAARSNEARLAEIERQKQLQADRDALLGKDINAGGADATKDRLGDAVEARTQDYMSRVAMPTSMVLDQPVYATSVVRDDAARTLAGALAGTRERLRARSVLEGGGDVADENRRRLLASATRFGTLGGIAQGSLNASKLEQGIQPTAYSNSGLGLGDVLQTSGIAAIGGANTASGWLGYTPPPKV